MRCSIGRAPFRPAAQRQIQTACVSSDSDRANALRFLVETDLSAPVGKVEDTLKWLRSNAYPPGVSPISIRTSLIHYSRLMSSDGLLLCFETFAESRVPDHTFFKEVGKLLEPKVSDMTVAEISRLLRAHALAGVTESPLFASVFGRLSTVINRANMSQIRDILLSLSRLESSVPDCMRMVELCFNRYSLGSKETTPIDVEKDILVSLARLQITSPRIVKKVCHRLLARFDQLSLKDCVQVMTSLHALQADTPAFWKATKSKWLSDPSLVSTHNLASLGIASDIEFLIASAVVVGRRFGSQPPEMRKLDLVDAYKFRFAMTRSALVEPTEFISCLETLTVSELRAMRHLWSVPEDAITEQLKGSFLAGMDSLGLRKVSVSGLFTTQIVTGSLEGQKVLRKKK